MKRLNYTLFIVFILFFTSCKTSMVFTTLDILRPAQVEFPLEVENLLIINNSKIQPADIGHNTRFFNGQTQDFYASADSVSLFALSVLAEEIEQTNFFTSVDLLLNSVNQSADFNTITPLSRATVNRLFGTHNVDAILSLDHIVVRSEIQEHYYRDWSYFSAVLDVRYDSFWSIHYPNNAPPVALHFQDSLFWLSESHRRSHALEGLPNREDAIIDGALWVGANSARRFVPFWEESDRFFYDSNNRLMRQAMERVVHRDWEGAIEFWTQAFNSTNNSRRRAEASNNIAIAHEILGNYEEALRYARISFDIYNARTIVNSGALIRLAEYILELSRRQQEVLLLNRQLGVTNTPNP